MGRIKDTLISQLNSKPFVVGDTVNFTLFENGKHKTRTGTITDIKDGTMCEISISGDAYGGGYTKKYMIPMDGVSYDTDKVGVNPFPANFEDYFIKCNIRKTCIASLVCDLKLPVKDNERFLKEYTINDHTISELCFNPFIRVNGTKIYYQRDYCWTLEDEQKFINSIYMNVDCGRIVVRNRSWDYLEKCTDPEEYFFKDVVDGKQRLHCLIRFMNDEFPDSNGYYYSDFSDRSKRKFEDLQIFTLVEIRENVPDSDVINIFMNVNTTGVQMPQSHIDKIIADINNAM